MGYNIGGDILAQGMNAVVRVDLDDENGSNPVDIGFVESWNIRRSFQTQKAEVVGEMLPVSIDITGVDVSVNLSGFIPTKAAITKGISSIRGGGSYFVKNLNPNVEALVNSKVITKIPYMDFYDARHETIYSTVMWLTPTENSESSSGKNYLKTDASFTAITSDNGTDYEQKI